MFAKTFGCVRFIYNKMLGDRLDYYKETGKKLNNTPAQYKEDFPWLKEVDSLALANAQMNLNKAYNNFFRNRKHFGKPHFKSKKTGHCSYSTNNQKGSVRLEGNKVKDDANYPNFLRKAEKRLAQAQRKLSKRQKGSHNREKQRLRVAVLHEKIANQRREFLHKKTAIW